MSKSRRKFVSVLLLVTLSILIPIFLLYHYWSSIDLIKSIQSIESIESPLRLKQETSFYNEWFRKYFEIFDFKGHSHHKSLPIYYPIKTQKLFVKYIILSNYPQFNDKYKCKFKINRNETIENNPTFKHFKIGETSSAYSIDWNSFHCQTLLTFNGYLIWKINFFIIEKSSIMINKTIRDFEIRINAFYPNHTNKKSKNRHKHNKEHRNTNDMLRSGGKVRDPIFDSKYNIWRYPAHFYIFEPNLWHNIYPIHTYNNRYFEFKHDITPDLGREYPLELFQNNTDYKIINQHYIQIFGDKLTSKKFGIFNISDYMDDLKEMKYYGSTLKNTPFQIIIDFYHYKFDENMPSLYCYDPLFHFDQYQTDTIKQKQINVKINNDIIDITEDISFYVFPQRIGRWYFDKTDVFNFNEGAWIEPDCEWKRFSLNEIEREIFVGSNMNVKLIGASNYQRVIGQYMNELCPMERDVFQHGNLCINPNNTENNEISFEWQYFRGSCIYWRGNTNSGCADIWTDRIVHKLMNQYNNQFSCKYMFGLQPQTPNHRVSNITLISNGLWTHRYSNLSHTIRLYEGFEYMLNDCWDKFNESMNKLVIFYKQLFATHAAPTKKPELARFINFQLEHYIEFALKTINKKKQYINGVIWDFERTFNRHITGDRMHQYDTFYIRHNHDIFNEIFRYIPSNLHNKCMSRFDQTCLMSIIHQF